MRRPQFTLRTLLVALLAAACFFGAIQQSKYAESASGRLVVSVVMLGAAVVGSIVIWDIRRFPMSRRFQFNLRALFYATTLSAVGAGLLLAERPFPRVPIVFPFACCFFGAAAGIFCNRAGRFAVYGFVAAVLFIAYMLAT